MVPIAVGVLGVKPIDRHGGDRRRLVKCALLSSMLAGRPCLRWCWYAAAAPEQTRLLPRAPHTRATTQNYHFPVSITIAMLPQNSYLRCCSPIEQTRLLPRAAITTTQSLPHIALPHRFPVSITIAMLPQNLDHKIPISSNATIGATTHGTCPYIIATEHFPDSTPAFQNCPTLQQSTLKAL